MKADYLTSIILSVIIAFLPLISFVEVPGLGIGLGMFSIIIWSPWLIFICLTRLQLNDIAKFSFFICFCAYSIYVSWGNVSNAVGFILILIWGMGTYKNLINEKILFGIMSAVSIIAGFIIVAQILSYYVFGYTIRPYIPSLYEKSIVENYYDVIFAGSNHGKMYRPSAFFLEPSHFSEYSFMALLWNLFGNKWKNGLKIAAIISLGILLTRSGMGIAMVAVAWAIYYIIGLDLKKNENIVNAVLVAIVCVFVIIVCLKMPFFQSAVNRVSSTEGDYNAISGRLFWWNYYFGPLSLTQLVMGCGYNAVEMDKYMTGFMKLLYCSGIIGVILFYSALFQHVKKNNEFKNIAIIFYSVLCFFAGLTSVMYLVFYFTIIFSKKQK